MSAANGEAVPGDDVAASPASAPSTPDDIAAASAPSEPDVVVDVSALASLDAIPLAEQVAVYERLHQGVQAALARIENG